MKGWKDISRDLVRAFYKDETWDKEPLPDRIVVANVLKELINQFKEVYEIDEDEEDEYGVDFVIDVRDIKQIIWELEK